MDAAFPPPSADAHAMERGDVLTPRFDAQGLVAAVAQHADTGEVLMLAWMNAEALACTLETRQAHYWSRSRGALWLKGETSGQVQDVVELRVDCDQDAVLLRVRPRGDGGACHVGFRSCFYRVAEDGPDGARLVEAVTGDAPDDIEDGSARLELTLDASAGRIDKVLAQHPVLVDASISRERLKALMAAGSLTRDGVILRDPSGDARTGVYTLDVPAPEAAEPVAQDLPLTVLFEDGDLIVIDKAAGMAAHPGPGTPDGTLVNALLHHCGASLSGVGGVLRPGIVHRLDKDTSGVMVAAKSDRAHAGLSALFAAHTIDREYLALVRGAPAPLRGTVETRLGRSPHDRKKMAVLRSGGREAVTRYATERTWSASGKVAASRVRCRLETGRTHQIRVHLAHKGAPCLGDPVYGSGSPVAAVRELIAEAGLSRQALHAAVLGFRHPVTGDALRFETAPPADMRALEQGFDTHLT